MQDWVMFQITERRYIEIDPDGFVSSSDYIELRIKCILIKTFCTSYYPPLSGVS